MTNLFLSLGAMLISAPRALAETTTSLDSQQELPLYVSARTSVASPFGGHGQIPCGGISLGMPLDQSGRTLLGMRAIYILNPPPNPLSQETPEVPWGWKELNLIMFTKLCVFLKTFCKKTKGRKH